MYFFKSAKVKSRKSLNTGSSESKDARICYISLADARAFSTHVICHLVKNCLLGFWRSEFFDGVVVFEGASKVIAMRSRAEVNNDLAGHPEPDSPLAKRLERRGR